MNMGKHPSVQLSLISCYIVMYTAKYISFIPIKTLSLKMLTFRLLYCSLHQASSSSDQCSDEDYNIVVETSAFSMKVFWLE